ncbi:MAG: hypothetical protein MR828_00045, partial [Clostridiales bacterium]|nr:hypothetical protein [Clostridiales bacterium]
MGEEKTFHGINHHFFGHASLGQHRTMGAAGFGGSFVPIVQYEKWEIHPVFPHFPYFRSGPILPPNLFAPLCGDALEKEARNMVKGISRQVIVVHSPDPKLF